MYLQLFIRSFKSSHLLQLENKLPQLLALPSGNLLVGEFHVAGQAPVEHDIWTSLMHMLCAWVMVDTFCMPCPKIVSTTSAATRITTTVTTSIMVVDSPFIHIIWLQRFKNLLYWKEVGFAAFQ
jgi:hypothetical protein